MEKILIIDDEKDIGYFLTRNLNKRHFETAYVNTLMEAKELIETLKPSILLLDNHLPDGFGVDFALEVKEKYPHIKIVMITAHDIENDINKTNIDYFLAKPFVMSEIYTAIETVKAVG